MRLTLTSARNLLVFVGYTCYECETNIDKCASSPYLCRLHRGWVWDWHWRVCIISLYLHVTQVITVRLTLMSAHHLLIFVGYTVDEYETNIDKCESSYLCRLHRWWLWDWHWWVHIVSLSLQVTQGTSVRLTLMSVHHLPATTVVPAKTQSTTTLAPVLMVRLGLHGLVPSLF